MYLLVSIIVLLLCGVYYIKRKSVVKAVELPDECAEEIVSDSVVDHVYQRHKKARKKPLSTQKFKFESDELITTFKGHTAPISACSISFNGKGLVTSASDETIFSYNVHEAYKQKVGVTQGSRNNLKFERVTRLCWSPDYPAVLAHTENDQGLHVLKGTKKGDGTIGSLQKHRQISDNFPEEPVGLGMAHNGAFIITVEANGTVRLWDVRGQLLLKRDLAATCVHAVLSPDSRFVAISCIKDSGVKDVIAYEIKMCLDGGAPELNVMFQLRDYKDVSHDQLVLGCEFSADGSKLVTVSSDGVWKISELVYDKKKGWSPKRVVSGSLPTVVGETRCLVRLCPDLRSLCVSLGSSLHFFTATTAELIHSVEGIYQGDVVGLFYDSGSKFFVTVGDNHPHIFHNIAGFKATIQDLKASLDSASYSGLRDRLKVQIKEAETALSAIYASSSS